jgi:hypothetical protein
MLQMHSTVEGVPQLINRLKSFEPEIYKILTREIRDAANLVGASARSSVPTLPLSHWGHHGRTAWDAGKVSSSIKPGIRSRNVGGHRVVSGVVTDKSVAGSIYEVAGSKSSGQFATALKATSGTVYARLLGPAWNANIEQAREEIDAAVHRAAEKVING